MIIAGDDSKENEREGELDEIYNQDPFHVLADLPIALVVAVLVEILFIKKEPEHSGGRVLEFTEKAAPSAFPNALEASLRSMVWEMQYKK